MAESRWDAVIAGCGLAGLSLAYALSTRRTDNFRILLIDKEKRMGRDHTWCFWEAGNGEWDALLAWEWKHIEIGLSRDLKKYPLDKYTYKLLESCLLYTSPSPRDGATSRMPSSA